MHFEKAHSHDIGFNPIAISFYETGTGVKKEGSGYQVLTFKTDRFAPYRIAIRVAYARVQLMQIKPGHTKARWTKLSHAEKCRPEPRCSK